MTLLEMSRRGRRDRKNEGVPRHVLRGRSSLAEPGGSGQKSRRNSESGAVLILALVYIIAISLTVGALARWATDDLDNTNNFSVTGQLHTAMTSAMTTAIESIRYTPWPSGTGTTGEYLLPTKGVATGWGWCFQPTSGTVSSITLTTYTKSVPTLRRRRGWSPSPRVPAPRPRRPVRRILCSARWPNLTTIPLAVRKDYRLSATWCPSPAAKVNYSRTGSGSKSQPLKMNGPSEPRRGV